MTWRGSIKRSQSYARIVDRSSCRVSKVDLRLDWVGHDAAKFAVEHWHYSHAMPKSKLA